MFLYTLTTSDASLRLAQNSEVTSFATVLIDISICFRHIYLPQPSNNLQKNISMSFWIEGVAIPIVSSFGLVGK